MRAIWYDEQGRAADVLTLGEIEPAEPGPGEVAVRIAASGVNPSDVKQRAGARGPMNVARQIPHSDGAGEIEAVGEGVDTARIGERVWLYNAAFRRAGGTCAETCVLPSDFAVTLPQGTEFIHGAALGVPAMTAHRALTCAGPVMGASVLVTGGAGSVGNAAIQLARSMGAARVITTVSSPEKAEAAWTAGADEVIDYTAQDVVEAVRAATDGQGVDHVVEVEFGGNLRASAEILKPHGSIAAYGSEAERTPELDFYPLMFRNASIHTVFVYQLTLERRARAAFEITRALKDGALTPLIDRTYALEDCVSAHERVEDGKIGSVVVEV
ncbi:MAG: NADPH:quinone reductase [Oceanicaulis sp.]